MRVVPLGPSVGLPMGPRNVVLGGGDACGRSHWDLRWGYGATQRCTGCAGRTRAGSCVTHAGGATGAVCGAVLGPRSAVLGGA
eukprot:3407772-Pyramimonas_sp.AAC.1